MRIGAVLRPEPDPEEQLSGIASDLEVEEFDDWMRDYRAGRWLLVCAQMFADVVSSDGATRYCDGGVHSLYFAVPHGPDNVVHAREAVGQYLDSLASVLSGHDVDLTVEDLHKLPIVIELARELETQLAV